MNRTIERFAAKRVTPEEAARRIRNGDRIYLGSMCSEPVAIIRALEASYVEDVEIVQFIGGPEATRLAEAGFGRFRMKTFFAGFAAADSESVRVYNYVPLFHSQIPFFSRIAAFPSTLR